MLSGSLALPPPRVTPELLPERLITPVADSPSARAAKRERHAMLEHRLGERDDVVDRRRQPAVDQRLGAHGRASEPGWRAGPGPQAISAIGLGAGARPGRAERASLRIASTTLSGTGSWRTSRWMPSAPAR